MEILRVNDLKKTYSSRFGGSRVQALKGGSFSVEKGEYVAIMGESGSGKTTLLNILAVLDKPSSGRVILDGRLGEKSSGLGLYLARKAADLLDIPLRAESSPGEGSRFSLDLGEKLSA